MTSFKRRKIVDKAPAAISKKADTPISPTPPGSVANSAERDGLVTEANTNADGDTQVKTFKDLVSRLKDSLATMTYINFL
jgi:hypothetical protein